MAFDQTTRNRLQKFVAQAREILTREFTRQLQNDYGMDPDAGTLSDIGRLTHLDDALYQTAILLRETLAHYEASSPGSRIQEILSRIVREQAFTVLNRLCALRMAEGRGIVMESIAKGYQSKGFQLYERVAGSCFGTTGDAFRNYLFSVFDEFALDLAVLFDRYSHMGRLFPRESVLLELLDLINEADLDTLWVEDETIGWIYQYFNSAEERKKMRAESQAPRNSRELAVRNQFFTPRYVVEFLTDNTLGRIWYEMTQGKTVLKDQCRYLVRRPNEIFLSKGEPLPEQAEPDADLTQEALLQLPVYIEHRPLKDPREILMLDPACGSMHFGLYAFDLFEKIYEEAWSLQTSGQWQGEKSKKFSQLTKTYPTREDFQTDIPRLIIENNIHGIDIDPRAVQIAGLSLWLRAQRSWQKQQIPPGQRPEIRKAHIVCAEPMPGETEMLIAFSETLKPRVLGQLVEIIFEKMSLAGEAGSLLKIEEEIEEAIGNAREAFNQELVRRKDEAGYLPGMAPKVRQRELFDFADLPDKTQFWETAEEKILEALKGYAEQAEEENVNRRRLFAEDAAKGFAFIDLFRKRYDVVLMNPPFGESSRKMTEYTAYNYTYWARNILCSFIIRMQKIQSDFGFIGLIFDRTVSIKSSYETFRKNHLVNSISFVADTGWNVLDANVETTINVLTARTDINKSASFFDVRESDQDSKPLNLLNLIRGHKKGNLLRNSYFVSPNQLKKLPNSVIGYYFDKVIIDFFNKYKNLADSGLQARKGHDFVSFEHFRLFWEIDIFPNYTNSLFSKLYNGSIFTMFYAPSREVVEYSSSNLRAEYNKSTTFRNKAYQNHFGIGYGKRGQFLDAHVLSKDSIFTSEGLAITKIKKQRALEGLAFLNSVVAQMTINQYCGQHKQVGYVNMLPMPIFSEDKEKILITNTKEIIKIKKKWCYFDETTFDFICSFNDFFLKSKSLISGIKSVLEAYSNSKKELVEKLHKNDMMHIGVVTQNSKDQQVFLEFLEKRPDDVLWADMDNTAFEKRSYFLTDIMLSYQIGCLLGRWDINKGFNFNELYDISDPFDPLTICPPGMLQNADGLPAQSKDVSADYPLRITWSGIIVDDEGHPDDIITRVREAMELIWKDRVNDIEQEACEILGVGALRDYFSKPGKFFAEHLKKYSKSRRQAPIYWPLSTPSGTYTLWLYYHRLSDQILYTCVNNFVGPKLKQVSEEAAALQKKTGRTRQEEKDLETLTNMAAELSEFQEELLRIAAFWKPDLNDGVQITAAPLWKLFQHKPWQKKLRQTWKDLEKGEYDWAHLAYSIWPDRVIRASHKDRSYAIAHDLEEYLWEEIETGTDRQGNVKTQWVSKELSEKQLKAIIDEKTAQPGH